MRPKMLPTYPYVKAQRTVATCQATKYSQPLSWVSILQCNNVSAVHFWLWIAKTNLKHQLLLKLYSFTLSILCDMS
jgi:uncharacterized membrane protein YcfT